MAYFYEAYNNLCTTPSKASLLVLKCPKSLKGMFGDTWHQRADFHLFQVAAVAALKHPADTLEQRTARQKTDFCGKIKAEN